VLAQLGKRLVDVIDGEHHAQVTEGLHRVTSKIGDRRRRGKSRELEPRMATTNSEKIKALLPCWAAPGA
jgi:hypothetical protein